MGLSSGCSGLVAAAGAVAGAGACAHAASGRRQSRDVMISRESLLIMPGSFVSVVLSGSTGKGACLSLMLVGDGCGDCGSTHSDLDAAQVGGELESDRATAQGDDNAPRILQPDACTTSGDRRSATEGRIGAGEIRRLAQIKGAPNQLAFRCADGGADTQSADAERIALAAEHENPFAATNTDDESRPGDLNDDRAGLGPAGCRMAGDHHG